MKKQLINLRVVVSAMLLLLIGNSANAQTIINPTQNSSNQEKCAASIIHNQMMQTDLVYVQRMQEFENYVLAQSSSITPKVAATYRIPVVVHVIHKGEAVGVGTNVSDADIQKAIKNMNERYRKTKPGLSGVDTGIEFALAVRDPNGNCTNGITRVNMNTYSNTSVKNTYLASGVEASSSSGITDDELKAITSWNRSKYYNIYLVSEFDNNNGGSGVQGYAYMAGAHGQSMDGAAILSSNFTNDFTMTTTHELGHALNLHHTFEGDGSGNTCPPSNPTQGDMCADTPPHKRSQSNCNTSGSNSCDGGSSNNLFIHNYMDYSSDDCVNMFTANQRTRALAACSGLRASFFAAGNLALVPVSAPTADFSATKSIICSGQSVHFYDESACVPNTYLDETNFTNISFLWTFTNGGTTLTSTLQNPVMNFITPGAYDVTLKVTTPAGTNTITKSSFVVLGGTLVSACTPNIGQSGLYGQTISNVKLNTINSSTSAYTNTYQNLSCSQNTIVNPGTTYPISVTGNSGGSGIEKFEVYIDYNNNGVFAASELVHSGSVPNGTSQTFTANVTIPVSAVTNTLLRMRVTADINSVSLAKSNCSTFSAGDVQDYGIYITNPCTVAPTISTQPVDASVCAGANTTYAVVASNSTSYVWQVSTNGGTTWIAITNGGVYSNATTATLTITAATTAMNNYKYRCLTTNSCGSTTTAVRTLTVNSSPTITSNTPNSRCGTGTVILSATGSAGTLSWFTTSTGGTAIGTGSPFTTPSITATKTYYVSVTNAGCTSARTSVVATVNNEVTMTSVPSNTTICEGQSVKLTAANGTAYSWSSGQTGTSITVSPSQTTTYTVTASAPCASTASITVTVNSCLGVNDNDQDDLFVLYPNPANSSLTIESVNLNNYQNVELRDVTGRLILVKNVDGSKMNLDLTQVANGNYIIHIIGTEKSITRNIQVVR